MDSLQYVCLQPLLLHFYFYIYDLKNLVETGHKQTRQKGRPQGEAVTSTVSSFTTIAKDKMKKVKLAMPVDVKVDFLQPTIETVRGACDSVWQQLPPQAQLAAPYVGVALGSAFLVYVIQQRRVNYYKRKRDGLVAEVKALQKDKDDLKYKVGVLKAGGGIDPTCSPT